jgi:hypothetical protein
MTTNYHLDWFRGTSDGKGRPSTGTPFATIESCELVSSAYAIYSAPLLAGRLYRSAM